LGRSKSQFPHLRFVEVDVDTTAYDQGHIPGAVAWNCKPSSRTASARDLIDKPTLERLLSASGISNDTTILLYGDNNNWFAAYALWQLKLYGQRTFASSTVAAKSGSRKATASQRIPKVAPASYHVSGVTIPSAPARKKSSPSSKVAKPGQLVDVRSVDEFTGKIIALRA